jgi:membrane-associated phospholipid phosphatase
MNIMPHRPPTTVAPGAGNAQWPRLQRLAVPLVMIAAGTLAFVAISADVVCHGRLWQIDHIVAPYLKQNAQPWPIWVCAAFSGLGDRNVLFPLTLFFGGWLGLREQWRCLISLVVGLAGSGLINGALKALFAIPRPQATSQFAIDNGPTYPSGHTMGATVAAGLLVLVWMRLKPLPRKTRIFAALVVAAVGVLEAAALTYIGVHYVTDVLAALAVSLAWLGVWRAILPPAAAEIQKPLAPAALSASTMPSS